MAEKNYKTLYLPDDLRNQLADVVKAINATVRNPKHTTGPSELTEMALEAFLGQGEPAIRRLLAKRHSEGYGVPVAAESQEGGQAKARKKGGPRGPLPAYSGGTGRTCTGADAHAVDLLDGGGPPDAQQGPQAD